MKKKVVSMLLVGAMVASLTACGSSTSSTSTSSNNGSETTAEGGEAEVTTNFANADGTPLQLVMQFPTFTGAPVDTQVVQDAVNEILGEKLGVNITLQIYDWGSYKQSTTLSLAGGEQIDILSTILCSYPTLVSQGNLIDMEDEDLIANYGPDIIAAIGEEYVDACRIDGVLYGVPNNRDFAQGKGCYSIGAEYLDGIGYEYSDDNIIMATEEEMIELLGQLHEAYPDIETFRPATSQLTQYTTYDFLGSNDFGVLENYGEKLEVVNLFESEEYINYCKMMKEWNDAGWISKDAATDTTAVGTLMANGVLVAYATGGKPGSRAQESSAGKDCVIFQTKKDYISSSSCSGYPWAIPITTVNKEAAMAVLNELYTNPELADLIVYGIKDTHYTITEDGLLDSSLSDAYGTLGWLYPNQFNNTVSVGNPSTLWDDIREFNEGSMKSEAVGFSFDATSVENEIAACTNVYNEHLYNLEYGFSSDVDAELAELNTSLYAAGLQTIIDEKQAQLDAWAEAVGK